MAKNLAHITTINGNRIEQTVANHSFHVADYAANKLKNINLYYTAYLAGLLHDMGKCTAKFQDYLERAAKGEDVVRGSVNHTFCGCIYLLKNYHLNRPQGFDTMTCEILVFAIGSHHGLFDCITPDNTSGFEHRLNKDASEIGYDEAVSNFLLECESEEEIDRLFKLAQNEIYTLFKTLTECFGNSITKISYLMGMVARIILSAVIDGDRQDTAEFMNGTDFYFVQGSKELWKTQLKHFEQKYAKFNTITPINHARGFFSEQCLNFAQKHEGGIYRLTLPTGGGKTLASLRYALSHATEYSKKRIIFVIPLLSILEQNSAVIRKYIQDESILTEHHSNMIKTFETEKELDQYELLCDTWNSPIIITTLVQLLNTLFSHRTTAIRRMNALCDSIIVIDEIQSLPKKTTNLFLMALNFLAYGCGATVVLSSATQPCFDKTVLPLKYSMPTDIVPYDKEIFEVFKRTKIVDKTTPYGMAIEELSDFSVNILETVSSLLIICNTKASALKIFADLKQQCNEHKIFHLSASMCMNHRIDTLARINECLKNKEKIVCISTQLVEAGVDFSFESVIRVEAGMDNIAQAAGRCNRSNDFNGICSVYVVNLRQDVENLGMLHEIETAQRCTKQLFYRFAKIPVQYDNDLLSEKSISDYYQYLFQDKDMKGIFSFPQKTSYGDTENLFDLLAENSKHLQRTSYQGQYFLNQSFKTAGKLFKVFDDNTTVIIVPYNKEAEEIIADLYSEKAKYDYFYLKECIEKAKPYTVQIFEYQKQKLQDYGMLTPVMEQHCMVLDKQCYNQETGLMIENFIF